MAKKPITMLQIRRILQLLKQGESKRKMAQILHSGRHTIDSYVLKIEQSGISLPLLIKLSDADLALLFYPANKDTQCDQRYDDLTTKQGYFSKELTRPGVTKFILWQEYREASPEGYGYSRFCDHFGSNTRKSAANMHFEHKPGERVQIDFAGKPLCYIDRSTGELISCPVLVCVLIPGFTMLTIPAAKHGSIQSQNGN